MFWARDVVNRRRSVAVDVNSLSTMAQGTTEISLEGGVNVIGPHFDLQQNWQPRKLVQTTHVLTIVLMCFFRHLILKRSCGVF